MLLLLLLPVTNTIFGSAGNGGGSGGEGLSRGSNLVSGAGGVAMMSLSDFFRCKGAAGAARLGRGKLGVVDVDVDVDDEGGSDDEAVGDDDDGGGCLSGIPSACARGGGGGAGSGACFFGLRGFLGGEGGRTAGCCRGGGGGGAGSGRGDENEPDSTSCSLPLLMMLTFASLAPLPPAISTALGSSLMRFLRTAGVGGSVFSRFGGRGRPRPARAGGSCGRGRCCCCCCCGCRDWGLAASMSTSASVLMVFCGELKMKVK